MADENQKRCNSRSDQGSDVENGDQAQTNTSDEDSEIAGRQGGRSQRLRGSQRRDAGSQRTRGHDESGDC